MNRANDNFSKNLKKMMKARKKTAPMLAMQIGVSDQALEAHLKAKTLLCRLKLMGQKPAYIYVGF